MNHLRLASLLSLLGACGCSREPPPPERATTAATASSAGETASAKRPRIKEYQTTPDGRLGTLPDGVGVDPGKSPPDATLTDLSGASVDLAELAETRGPLLVVFYRGGWCPYCNFEIHELAATYPEYQKRGVLPVAISVDKPTESAKTTATYVIPFPVLSDPDLRAHEAFRVIHSLNDAEVTKLRNAGMDIEEASGRQHHKFAIPALFVVDRSFTVRWSHADADYKVRPRTPQILAAIDKLGLK